MDFAFIGDGRVLRAVGRAVLALAVASSLCSTAQATGYSESVSGDLSSNSQSPTKIGALTLGGNFIGGATIPSGPIVNVMTGERAVEDDDYVTFTVPTGYALSSLVLGGTFVPGDRMFFGIAQGDEVDVDPSFTSATGLLGWTLVGAPMVGTDVLPALGKAAPAMFPPIPGATRFSGALGAGDYTLWMVDGDQPAIYSLDLVVTAVPEAATWAMMAAGLGVIGATLRRKPRRRLRATA